MNNFLNEYFWFTFELNIELNNFFPYWMNNLLNEYFSIEFWIKYWIESIFGPIQRKNE